MCHALGSNTHTVWDISSLSPAIIKEWAGNNGGKSVILPLPFLCVLILFLGHTLLPNSQMNSSWWRLMESKWHVCTNTDSVLPEVCVVYLWHDYYRGSKKGRRGIRWTDGWTIFKWRWRVFDFSLHAVDELKKSYFHYAMSPVVAQGHTQTYTHTHTCRYLKTNNMKQCPRSNRKT